MKARTTALAAGVFLVASVLVFALSFYTGGGAGGEATLSGLQRIGEPRLELVERETDPSSSEAAAEVVSMIGRWTEPLLERGWLYVREEVAQSDLELGVLPDGAPIPDDYVFESWYLLDDGGFVVAGVSRMIDMEGKEVQVSVYEDSTWKNLTFGFEAISDPFRPNLDHGVTLDLTAPGRIASFDEVETEYGGEAARVVTTYEDFPTPVDLEGLSGSIGRIAKRAVFDAAAGALRTYETFYRAADGKEVGSSTVTVLVADRIDAPPSGILDLFQEKPQ